MPANKASEALVFLEQYGNQLMGIGILLAVLVVALTGLSLWRAFRGIQRAEQQGKGSQNPTKEPSRRPDAPEAVQQPFDDAEAR